MPQKQRFWAIVTTAMAVFITVVGASVANVALPTIAADLGVEPSDAVWIVNAYQVAILISLLPLASLGDIIGYRRVYLSGLVLFSAASLVCALSPSLTALVLARVAQGIGAAGVMSVNQALVRFIHPSHRLGYGIGITAVVIAVSAAAGPAIASAILSVLTWPWLFALGVPVGVIALGIGIRALPVTPRASHRFDVVSSVLNVIAFGSLVVLIDSAGRGGSPILIGSELAITLVAAYLLWRRQLSLTAPLLPIDLLRIPVFALSIAVCASSFAAQMLALVVLPFHLTAAGYSAVADRSLDDPLAARHRARRADRGIIVGSLSRRPARVHRIDDVRRRSCRARFAARARKPDCDRLADGARGSRVRPLPIAQQPDDPGLRTARTEWGGIRHGEHGAALGTDNRRRTCRVSLQPLGRRCRDRSALARISICSPWRHRQRGASDRLASTER